MRRDLAIAGIIWAIATAVSLAAAVFLLDPIPTRGAEEAEIIDDSFPALTYLATPVFGLVIAVLAYSLFRFRSPGEPTEDGWRSSGAAPCRRCGSQSRPRSPSS